MATIVRSGGAGSRLAFAGLLLLGMVLLPLAAGAGEERPVGAKPPAAAGSGLAAAEAFDSPRAAADALFAACAKNDDAALKRIVGAGAEDVVQSGQDPLVAADRALCARLAKASLIFEGPAEKTILVVGPKSWPLPVPLVRAKDGRWRFDAAQGCEEMRLRRIGRNELRAIDLCRAYVSAQVEYASQDRDGDELAEYAQRIVSTPGKKDGLYWPADPEKGEALSPVGPLIASLESDAPKQGSEGAPVPFGGYYWTILKGQGSHVPGGAHSYVINGNMIAGFALVGVPAKWGQTGVTTFLVSNHGKVWQKDLGEKSLELVKAMKVFDPDDTWTLVTGPAGGD